MPNLFRHDGRKLLKYTFCHPERSRRVIVIVQLNNITHQNNNMNTTTALGRFRLVALLEGISYLVLLGVAMPLKYLVGIPEPVKLIGWAHGVLFVLFMVCLLQVWIVKKWSFWQVLTAFISSLLPFGTFVMDKTWQKEE